MLTVMPRSLMYSLLRGSYSPASPPVAEPTAPELPPNPPQFVHWFWLKRLLIRPLTSILSLGLLAKSISNSVPWPLSPQPSPGMVVKLYMEPS